MTAPQVMGFAAWSGTGKTTLLTQVIGLLSERGVRIAAIKHSHHDFEMDQPGKDSHRLRMAGAGQMLIASPHRWAMISETPERKEPELDELLARIDAERADLILVEGFKQAAFPKIELHRPELGRPLLYPDDPNIIAVATHATAELKTGLPRLDINQPDAIADFIQARFCY